MLWTAVSSANSSPSQANELSSVACASSTDCWAVGSYTGGSTKQTLVEQDAGGAWTIVSSPNPQGASASELLGVTCVSVSDCWAVGDYTTGGGVKQTLVEQDSGSGWAILASPDIGTGQDNQLLGISCVSAGDCWAVGRWAAHPLIEQYTGTWAIVTSPSTTAALLSGVTCLSSGVCWAVGYSYAGSADQTLIEQETSGTWAIVPSQDVSGGDDDLLGIGCVSATQCMAVGSTDTGTGEQTLIEQDTGSGWTIVTSPNTGRDDALSGVACDSSGDCWAVGYFDTSAGGADQTLIEEDASGAWTVVNSPDVGQSDTLAGDACLSQCVAVGAYASGGPTQTLVEQTYQPTGTAYTALPPFRVCDTRNATGTECSGTAADRLLGQGQTMTFQVTGVSGPSGQTVPASAQAVVLNVAAISGTSDTFLTVFPAGSSLPTASNLNVNARTNQANLVVTALGSGGQVSIYNSLGSINVAVDVQGYFAAPSTSPPPGLFHPIPPLRICDTRAGTGTACSGSIADNVLGPGQWTRVVVSGLPPGTSPGTPSVPADGTAAAVALNLTAVSGTSSTYLTAAPPTSADTCPSSTPSFSSLNVQGGTNLANRVLVALGPQQDVCVYNSLGSINFVLDINGWFGNGSEATLGAEFYPMAATRICDTRSAVATGYTTECSGASLGPGQILTIPVAGVDSLPAPGGSPPPVAVIANVTAVSGTSFTYFTLYPADVSRPTASDLNLGPQQNTPNLVIVELAQSGSSAGAIDLYNNRGTIDAVVDVAGWFQ